MFFFRAPSVLVRYGRFIDETMNKERIAPEEVFAELHKSGGERLEEVKLMILENDGSFRYS